jgi:lipoprotein-anchoring transpeptidase ErfK/SrfK
VSIFIIVGIVISLIFLSKRESNLKQVKKSFLLLKEAEVALSEGRLLEAKKIFRNALERLTDPNRIEEVKKKIEELNLKILFSPLIDECSIEYTVKPNDILIKIAKRFDTTVELIKKANNLNSDIIRPKQRLKINKCKFSIIIDKSQNLLFLKRGGQIIKTYTVATGKGNSTPNGSFKIVNKLQNPTWFKTGAVIPPGSPENILGSRWLGLDIKGYGIHGSRDINEIGRQVTMGCIRMRNQDVEELYDILPLGTEVTIID